MEYITESAEATQKLGKKLSTDLKSRVYALTGELGVGKTTFVQGFAEGLGINKRINSPTFILMRTYKIGDKKRKLNNFYHLDFYRLDDHLSQEVENLGLPEIWSDPDNIVLIEWAEKIKEFLPKDSLWVKFSTQSENKRKIEVIT